MHTLYQPYDSEYRWTKDHPLEQVRGNPSKPVQTRRQLATNLEMCMFALTVSTAKPKNIKEAMVDFAWIEAMQEELHQFDRLQVWELVDKTFLDKDWYIKLKWLWKNKKDEDQTVIRNKARLVAKGYAQPSTLWKYLKKHGMDKCDSIGTPMATKPKLDADLSGKHVDQTNYHNMIGSLMYLTSSRPYIVQAGAINMGLRYPKDSGFELTVFSNANHAGSEAEYMALSASCALVMWMRTQLKDYGFNYNKIPLYCDSQSAIAISCNPVQHSCTKHIHTRYHFIKEQVEHGIIELYFVITEYQLADMFTKALPEDRFQYFIRRIGMRCLTLAKLEVLANESA
ncbi:hypothetical protein Tco_0930990 [Tanacetum coccineum]